jgi:hypothetical protein
MPLARGCGSGVSSHKKAEPIQFSRVKLLEVNLRPAS